MNCTFQPQILVSRDSGREAAGSRLSVQGHQRRHALADVGLDRPSRPSSHVKGVAKKQILRGFKVKASEREGFERSAEAR